MTSDRGSRDGLRGWIADVRDRLPQSELRDVAGASSESEIGEITEVLDHSTGSPVVLFGDIPGFASGRVIVNCNGTIARQAITLGLDPETVSHEALLRFWSETLDELRPVPPVEVDGGPICENVLRGDHVDVTAFPAPIWHPGAGGRYIGTASINIVRDPDTGWVNAGTYRNQVLGR